MRQHTKSAASLLAATVACGMVSQPASAQFSSAARTSSASGSPLTSGTSAATGAAGATSGFGGLAGGNAANRTSGTGQPTFGLQQATQGNAQNAFIGGRNQQQFIGGNPLTGQQQNNRQQQQNNRRNNNNNNQNDNNQNGQAQQTQDPRRAIRPQYRVAFDELPRPTTEIRSTLQPRFDSLSQTPALRGVAYELDTEGVVVLRGTVETPAQRRLAENVVRLEPGVKKVRNELTLNEPAATK